MRAILTIEIVYDDSNVSTLKDIELALEYAAKHLANKGLLSDEMSVVDKWTYKVGFCDSSEAQKKVEKLVDSGEPAV